jgi:hypothetical protein
MARMQPSTLLCFAKYVEHGSYFDSLTARGYITAEKLVLSLEFS